MAIDKDVENEFGVEFKYHKLREVRIINDDKIGIQLTLTVYSWRDRQARIDGKQSSVRLCIIDEADFALTPFYALLKAKFPEFSNGDDDMDNSFKVIPDGGIEFSEQTANGKLIRRWREDNAGLNGEEGTI